MYKILIRECYRCSEDQGRGTDGKCGLIGDPDLNSRNGNYCEMVLNVCGRNLFIGLPDPSWSQGCYTFNRLEDGGTDGELYANVYEGDRYVGGCRIDHSGDSCIDSGYTSTNMRPRVRCILPDL